MIATACDLVEKMHSFTLNQCIIAVLYTAATLLIITVYAEVYRH